MSERQLFRLHASVVVCDGSRILLVQEEKPDCKGKWNLPGGHIDPGEDIPAAAMRELREETHLRLSMQKLIGIYRGDGSFRFVFRTDLDKGEPKAGDEIMAVQWVLIGEAEKMPDEKLVAASMFRKIMADVRANVEFPLAVFGGV